MTLETKTDCVDFLKNLSVREKNVFPDYAHFILRLSKSLEKSNLNEGSSITEVRDFLVAEVKEEASRGYLRHSDLAAANVIASNISQFQKVKRKRQI